MSLYYDAAAVLKNSTQNDSLKSRIYGNKIGLKSAPAHLYALISETAKYDGFLKEVVDNAGLLSQEPKLTPILSLLLIHDHFFSKRGLAAPSGHILRQAIERHKARIQAEFTKARLRRKCASVDDLRRHLLAQKPSAQRLQPRWVRINTLKSDIEQELNTTFKGYRVVSEVAEATRMLGAEKVFAIDPNIPDLIALPPEIDVTKTQAYRDGKLILQDKASCFPAYLLVGEADGQDPVGECIDGCAAPGNKTSYLAALLAKRGQKGRKIFACERDSERSKTLKTMMERSGANTVLVRAKCDFLTLDPHDVQFNKVTHLLLDPSCSGSGIIGREDMPTLILPQDPKTQSTKTKDATSSSKKRKRERDGAAPSLPPTEYLDEVEETRDVNVDKTRLQKLSNLQTRIVEHALSFPTALRVTYSTCSVYLEENEEVVARVLASNVAKQGNWRLLRREEQVAGLRTWRHRGTSKSEPRATESGGDGPILSDGQLESCIRCHPGDDEGTMGFFVCCFVRSAEAEQEQVDVEGRSGNDSWEGFSD